jgi:hypothetical protein
LIPEEVDYDAQYYEENTLKIHDANVSKMINGDVN